MKFNPNPNQIEVKEYPEKTLLVEAGPGSGKTTVIVERIKYLIEEFHVNPETFLVITFTRKAADNLKNKLKKKISIEDLNKMQISTIHSFCLQYLKDNNIVLELLDEDTSERKSLFIQKFKESLGFEKESTLLDYQIPGVSNKFEEYTYFKVDDKALLEYVKEKRPVSDEYLKFVDEIGYFSYKKLQDADKKRQKEKSDIKFTDDYYYARFQQVINAYQEYLKLLDEHHYVDYNTVQLKALEKLKENPETKYTTIFVDEFQDTDPLQFEIFKILHENCNYFTAVGDVDQHIYGFRSSFRDYFEEMQDYCDCKRISLDCNYRSTENIVAATDEFIKHQRSENSQKDLRSNNDEYNNHNFLVSSEDNENEAQKVLDIIKELKETGKIKDYGEVAVLYRKHSNKTVEELINKLNENKIDFVIKGQRDLSKQNEVRSILAMLWYMARKTYPGAIPTKAELIDQNLKQFTGEYFEPTFWSLCDETKQYLNDLQDSFYDDIVVARKKVREIQKRSTNVSSHRLKDNEDLDTIIEVFKRVQIPVVDLSKIEDEQDRKFFQDLDNLRRDLKNKSKTLLEVFYELLNFGDFLDDAANKTNELKNLAALSQSIYNYQTIISEYDAKGLLFFLSRSIENYTSNYDDELGVQLMTVHSAKGLEFPVTIVLSLKKDDFPSISKDPERKKKSINRVDTFYTPFEYLEYKKPLLDEYREKWDDESLTWMEIEDRLNEEEELRVIYVAMTRAADLLILSSVGELPESVANVSGQLTGLTSLNDLKDVKIEKHFTNQEKEILKMNFSKYNLYKSCPFNYHLAYDIGFMVPPKDVTDLGTVFHNVMDDVNQKLKHNETIDEAELKDTIEKVYSSLFDEKDPDEFEKLQKDILEYTYNKAGDYDVIDSELSFSVDRENYVLNGAVDLIYRIDDDEIGILDYKNAEVNDNKIKSYSRQLYTYASALKQMPEFKDKDITEAKIHFVKSGVETIDINDNLIKSQEEELNKVASKIIKEEFPKLTELYPDKDNYFCGTCEFKKICR